MSEGGKASKVNQGAAASTTPQQQEQPHLPAEDFDVAARIEQLQSYLEDPRFEKQRDNIEAALRCYREGFLPVKHGEPLVFQGGKAIELTADNLLNDEMIWFEEGGAEDELDLMEEINPDI
ncbi:hypothetical protein VTO42DRAFT_6363 [Malbranchea cinnamomea]